MKVVANLFSHVSAKKPILTLKKIFKSSFSNNLAPVAQIGRASGC